MKTRYFFILAVVLAAIAIFANTAMAQGAASAAAGTVSYQDICVPDPNAKLAPVVKPRKKVATIKRTEPVRARAQKLAKARKKAPTPVATGPELCPPGQKPMRVSFVTPLPPVQPVSLCVAALGDSAKYTTSDVSSALAAAGLSDSDYMTNGLVDISKVDDMDTLKIALTRALQDNPNMSPAIFAYVMRSANPGDSMVIQEIARISYAAAPMQVAGMTYAAVLSNPSQTLPITQALLGAASDADDSIVRQCAIDANPNLANDIATAAFVPALGETPLDMNDIRNTETARDREASAS